MDNSNKIQIVLTLIIVIVLILMLSLYYFVDPTSSKLFLKCLFFSISNFYCPGCGTQRAIHSFLKGDMIQGIRHNYMFILVFLVISYQATIFILDKLYSKKHLNLLHKSKTTNTIFILVILFWILRNIPYYPFRELAP